MNIQAPLISVINKPTHLHVQTDAPGITMNSIDDDWGPLSPLTPLSSPMSLDTTDGDKIGDGHEHFPQAEANEEHGWCRVDANGTAYLLPGEADNALEGPCWIPPENTSSNFPKVQGPLKFALETAFCSFIDRLDWSNRATVFSIINKTEFSSLLGKEIQTLLSREHRHNMTDNIGERNIRVAALKDLAVRMQCDSGMLAMRNIFLDRCIKPDNRPNHAQIAVVIKEVRLLLRLIKGQKDRGRNLAKHAKWIGRLRTTKTEINKAESKLVFENELLRRAACANYNLDEANTVSLGKDYARLCRPTESKKAPVAFYFWTMDSPEDNEPTYEKIFGAVIYRDTKADANFVDDLVEKNAEESLRNQLDISPDRDSVDSNFLQHVRARVVTDSVLRGQALKRSEFLCDGGAMMTTIGSGQSYSHFTANRGVKTAKAKGESEMVDKLRCDVREYMPVWQALEDAFIEGFLPTMAKDIQTTAAKAGTGLLNQLGTPNMSSFVTYGYFAGAHIDKDDSPSIGRVLRRDSTQVNNNESNFIYFSHRIIVELSEGSVWFWKSKEDHHGTSTNAMSLKHRSIKNWARLARDNPNGAQWTLVSVFPQAVVQAAIKAEANGAQ